MVMHSLTFALPLLAQTSVQETAPVVTIAMREDGLAD